MAQTNGLQPTQTSTSPADLNKENAGKQPGRSLTDGESLLIPGEIQVSAGGDMANSNSNDGFNHPVPVKHGKSAIINTPDVISSQSNNPTPTIALSQEAARIGNTGPNIGSNDVGNIGISTFSSLESVEKHVFSGTNYTTLSGTLAASVNNSPFISILGVYSGSSASTGSFPKSPTGLSGSGWSASGPTVVFTNGAYTSFSGAATAGMVPASGADFYIDYTYQTITAAPTTKSFTGLDNSLTPNYIPNVGNRFAR
jgi:hypothetical protein